MSNYMCAKGIIVALSMTILHNFYLSFNPNWATAAGGSFYSLTINLFWGRVMYTV